ncbi:MAG: Septum site-determining protein MinC [Anaerolineales bacterium]|nr:Septum site-determining protein MinC [Anaerolineales bacterium]
MMAEGTVTIKGTKDGLLVILNQDDWPTTLSNLKEHLVQMGTFFTGGKVMLQAGGRVLEAEELETVAGVFSTQGMTLTTVLSESAATRRAAHRLGFETERPKPQPPPRPAATMDNMVVRRTLRSGQSVHHPGSIVVIGDVNPGAEVVAGGDIIVWGHLRGVVHAGALGDNEAIVCALALAPTQLRIGNQIARPPEEEMETSQPETARVRDDQIVVEDWDR